MWRLVCWLLLAVSCRFADAADQSPQFERDIAPLLKRACVKCHGPTRQEGGLNLATMNGVLAGGKSGAALIAHDVPGSLIWRRVAANEMPPEAPLPDGEKSLLKGWIDAGSPGLKRQHATEADHWAFRVLPSSKSPLSIHADRTKSSARGARIDQFIAMGLARDGLEQAPQADRVELIRRVSFDLTGLPPESVDIAEFLADAAPDAYEKMVDRYLASPHFGERIGKLWLDAAGYADSNGYFGADTDRPLAYRYRDYVIRNFNSDRPLPEFLLEQIAGDELSGIIAANGGATDATEADIQRLVATHYLRCGQDGTGESDGNPDEVRVDRYTVIETAMQNISTGLLGLTIQCAKCHDHKFEPLTQQDYYRFQAVLIPSFPPEQWVKPNDRFIYATLPGEFARWQASVLAADADIARLSEEIRDWIQHHRRPGAIQFQDDFSGSPQSLLEKWSHTAPGDDAPGGTAAVHLNSREAPAAVLVDGRLQLIEGGPGGDKWLSTKTVFDWTPNIVGASIQATFDLVDDHIDDSKPSERIGYFIALHDFNDNSDVAGGNILIDGHPSSSTGVFADYPGADSKQVGVIGKSGYKPGHSYGVRITNAGEGKFLMQQLVDWQPEEGTITLQAADLPDGGFGFEFCCGRSFIVDNVSVETFPPSTPGDQQSEFQALLKSRRQPLNDARKHREALGTTRPGKIAWTTDVADPVPDVRVLVRGNYKSPGELVQPGGYAILGTTRQNLEGQKPGRGTGRRLDFARWLIEPDSPRSSLVARVHVNRLWQHCFGQGIVVTSDNLGLSGSSPSHPELLDCLAIHLIRSDWSTKSVVRAILESTTYQQSSSTDRRRLELDPNCRRLSRYPVRRLDAETIRDLLLAASGELDDQMFGPFIATTRTGAGETIVPEDNPGARRRSIYLQQKRTQINSLLQVFDAPSIVFNSTRRLCSTMPLQSLSQMNSEFVLARSQGLAARLMAERLDDAHRIRLLFLIVTSREAGDEDIQSCSQFLQRQTPEYQSAADARIRAWADLCQALLISNAAIYLD